MRILKTAHIGMTQFIELASLWRMNIRFLNHNLCLRSMVVGSLVLS